jgi:hypothetical protein
MSERLKRVSTPPRPSNPYIEAQRTGGYLLTAGELYLIEMGRQYVYTAEKPDHDRLTQRLREPVLYLRPYYWREGKRWTDNAHPIRTEIIDRTNEYVRRVEYIDLNKLPTFILIPKQVDAQTGIICVEAFTLLRNEGFIVFYTMVAGAGKLVCIPPPAKDQSDEGVDAHIAKTNMLMGQLSQFFIIGAGAGVFGSESYSSGIMISNDLQDVFPDG